MERILEEGRGVGATEVTPESRAPSTRGLGSDSHILSVSQQWEILELSCSQEFAMIITHIMVQNIIGGFQDQKDQEEKMTA